MFSNFLGDIFYNEPLSKHSSLKIGGLADFFIELEVATQLKDIINVSISRKMPILALGNGSNILFADKGFQGIVIRLPKGIKQKNKNNLNINAGSNLAELLSFCKNNDLGGLEFLTGIPGTIGGAIVTNAGAHNQSISDFITNVLCFDLNSGKEVSFGKKDCEFGYRNSFFRNANEYIISNIDLQLSDIPFDQVKYADFFERRSISNPKLPSLGSVFKNPSGYYAGALIEKYLGKGFKKGRVMISKEHANIFVNLGNATAKEFIDLIAITKKKVFKETNILLEEEIIILK